MRGSCCCLGWGMIYGPLLDCRPELEFGDFGDVQTPPPTRHCDAHLATIDCGDAPGYERRIAPTDLPTSIGHVFDFVVSCGRLAHSVAVPPARSSPEEGE
jgi:hypothetical protein